LEKFLQSISFPLKSFIIKFFLIISEFKKSNNKFFFLINFRQNKLHSLKEPVKNYFEQLIYISTTNLLNSTTSQIILPKKQKKNFLFISLFDLDFINNLILDLESIENVNQFNNYDFYELSYNNNFVLKSMLFNYSLFQTRIITNENTLFDNFFVNLMDFNLKEHEFLLYEYFILNYSNFFIMSDYNTQIIHSKDTLSLRNFFSISYYNFFRIQQDCNLFFNPVNILDDFRGFSTIIQLNNNILTQNIENYMLNLQKLVLNEITYFFDTKIHYLNNNYTSIYSYIVLNYKNQKNLNSLSLFEQNNLMFGSTSFNLFFSKLKKSKQIFYSMNYLAILIIFLGISFFSFNFIFFDFLFFIVLIIFFFFFFLLNRFFIMYEIYLFGYTNIYLKKTKLIYEKLYLSDYKITQYDDIYYYQQKYIMQRDLEHRNISNLISELDFNMNFESTFLDPSVNFFDKNLSELLFLNYYEILYDFESDWKDNDLEDLEILEMDRIELYHGYPLESFISRVTQKNLSNRLITALNAEDLLELYEELDDILDRQDSLEGDYDMLFDKDINEMEDFLDDLSEFFENVDSQDYETFSLYCLSSLYFSEKEEKQGNVALDTDSILNFDIPDDMSENIEDEFIDSDDDNFSSINDIFIQTQKKIQKKIFQTIYYELVQEKEFLITKYNLQFLSKNSKLEQNQLITLQKLLQRGCIPLWLFNMNMFYNEVKSRVFLWYQQLYATKKIYNNYTLALLNLEQFYTDQHISFLKYPNYIQFYLDIIEFFPGFLLFNEDNFFYHYLYERSRRNFSSSELAYTDIISNYSLTTSFMDDQSIVDVLEYTNFNILMNNKENIPIQLDFFNQNIVIVTQLLNTLNSNLYLLFCNNVNFNDSIFKNQILMFQHFIEYSILQIEQSKTLKIQISTLFDVIKFAKFNTLYDLEFFFYQYFNKYFKISRWQESPLLTINLINYYINKYSLYNVKLPTNINELQKFLVKLQQFEIFIGLESFESNHYLENQEMTYERSYNIPYNVFDKEYLEYEELDSYFLTEFFFDEKLQNQFFYNNIIYIERQLFIDDEIIDGDITKLPPYLPYTAFNTITSTIELKIPTLQQNKYIFPNYMYTTLYTEIADDIFDFDGFFL
jgi:hypothetical protein